MDEQKLQFLQHGLAEKLQGLHANTPSKWGKMNAQQMVEHLAAFFNVSAGKIHFDLVTPEEHLPKYKAFLLSDKAFRENTQAPLSVIGEDALPLRYSSLEVAKDALQRSVTAFTAHFATDKNKTTLHPVFGHLNYEEWVLLHYKHVVHHLKQFGLV